MEVEENWAGVVSSWWRCSDAQLAAELQAQERIVRQAQAMQAQVLAEMHSRGTQACFGYPDVVAVQKDLLHISQTEAKRRTMRALACHAHADGTVSRQPAAPAAAQAWLDGAIGGEHVDAVAGAMSHVPGSVPADERAGFAKTLTDLARESSPHAVQKAGRHLVALLDQDGPEPNEEPDATRPTREFRASWARDNSYRFVGMLDAETGQLLERMLSPLTKPRPADDGQPDTRSAEQRHGDAFAELVEHAQRTTERPVEAGEAPVVVVTMTLEQLRSTSTPPGHPSGQQLRRDEPPVVNWTNPITAEQARRLACDAHLIPAVLGSRGEVLDRLVSSLRLGCPSQCRRPARIPPTGLDRPPPQTPTQSRSPHRLTQRRAESHTG